MTRANLSRCSTRSVETIRSTMKATWRRKQQCSRTETTDFHKHNSHDWEEPQKNHYL